ncbi:DUF2163 domain-containing protein [Agrobacterium tumefaciens]|uniref:DUF2163 domain-containing protein n=1 Tax=Agrobacterium tumefaciens TaxID=358 RepID=UPI000DD0A725|nr:DUF2163 domain-containing protein [Agrobacterium tumefaciens]MCW8056367.1 DUF2163 domain-containing protein [Agrobacterium tumefaciens]MCW8144505.1 DUF2163 domain-containing protein [Agrobacterium tumefaciens]MDP9871334.1 putative phage protein (TIGR02218 family) [Agrobacterium tumefaciens]MDP9976946.1 putative phage protein (TIGR02218 family) [Agrobacterium tumefaciens]MQB36134.1 DUF2163 domain-containing protein [Agrobacterium tumefaciens]
MKTIPAALAEHLKGDATTTCHCWKVTLKDGVTIGFTDHDEMIVFGGTSYLAASGFAASDSDSETGLGASAGEVAGGFSSEAIAEDDLAAGRFDGARVELFLVNWQAPDQHMLLNMREIGEVTRAGGAFRAELRSLAHRLGQPQGRIYGRRCDAALGDRRCGVDLEPFTGHGNVVAVDASGGLLVSGLDAFADGFFSRGKLRFLAGLLAAKSFDLDGHERRDGGVHLSFWLPPEQLPSPGDIFSVTAGCDKSFTTCRAKFTNHLNFRGFPHLPGADFAYSYASGGESHDGGALFP